jgi:hypothetical protein
LAFPTSASFANLNIFGGPALTSEKPEACSADRKTSAWRQNRGEHSNASIAKKAVIPMETKIVERRTVLKGGAAAFGMLGSGASASRCPGEQLTIQVFEDFLRKVWRDKIVFRKLNLANAGQVPIGPTPVIEDDLGFTRSA